MSVRTGRTSRQTRQPMYTAEALQRLSSVLHIGAIAMEVGRPLRWDPKTESFNDSKANALRRRVRRDDWKRAVAKT